MPGAAGSTGLAVTGPGLRRGAGPAGWHLALLVGAVLACGGAAAGEAVGDGEQAQHQFKAVEQQLKAARAREETLSGEVAAQLREAERLAEELVNIAARIQSREALLSSGEARFRELGEREGRLSGRLARRRDQLAHLLAGLQRLERNPPPALVVKPDDALGALRGAILLGAAAAELKAEATALAQELAELDRLRADLVRQRRDLDDNLAKLAAERTEAASLLDRKRTLARSTGQALEAERTRSAELARRAKSLMQLLVEIDRRRADSATEAERTADAAEKRRLASLMKPSLGFAQLHGRLAFPAQGERLREFGAANGYGGRTQGLYLATRAEAQVTAPADATVEFAGEFRTYGQLLILNVGAGYHVLLAGLNKLTVDSGQGVRAGEPVGVMGWEPAGATLVGDRVGDQRPILYVEFRRNGTVIDPAPWWAGSGREARG